MLKTQFQHINGGIDVLCSNAGVMALEDDATQDGYDVQMQTNHLSHFLLTQEVPPKHQLVPPEHQLNFLLTQEVPPTHQLTSTPFS